MSATLVRDIMTKDPVTCSMTDNLGQVAQAMKRHDCGALPVVDDTAPHKPRGIVTDRDIVVRMVAADIDPLKMKAADVMTDGALLVDANAPVESCLDVMRDYQVRRVVVIDDVGGCCGIVALADVARHLDADTMGGVIQDILASDSVPSGSMR
jgi:CBS domain-containing protein